MTRTSNNAFTSNKPEQDVDSEHASAPAPSLTDELIQLSDDFGEFSDVSAFMCNAFANALKEHERLNREIISGARICADWLQQKTSELKDDISQVRTRYVAEHNEASPNDHTKTNEPVRTPPRHRAFRYFY
jgi:DnaJ-domain-containing protein 1